MPIINTALAPCPTRDQLSVQPSVESTDASQGIATRFDASESEYQFHTRDVSQQRQQDNHDCIKMGGVLRFMTRVIGHTQVRRLSNLLNACRCADIYPAHRDYAVLPPQARLKFDPGTAEALAQRYVPSFKTLKAEHGCDASVAPKQLRYEVLPPKAGNPVYSIIYYVGMDTEKLPIPVIGKMYSWARVLLYGAQQDWEAIQVDVNAHTGRPEGLSYESSNYTGDPATFDTIQRRNLHLRTRVALARDGSWQHTIYQKNGQARSVETTDPFEGDKGPAMLVVAWNGSFDLQAVARHRGVDKMFDFSDQPERLAFLSIKDIRATSMDLRVSWTQARKEGQTVMRMPARKPSLVPQHVTLMAE